MRLVELLVEVLSEVSTIIAGEVCVALDVVVCVVVFVVVLLGDVVAAFCTACQSCVICWLYVDVIGILKPSS
ncbi:hypothetical protein [Limimaricola soesokkakensis]|uniref:hypothetical protein n=1 Tax=Limimaricola soesokkakensis TaxID=1343159 RepID=UPI003514292B